MLGRSNIVGMPVALLLVKRDATVTICHSRSKDLPGICRAADVLIAAVGRPEMVRGDWIKPGAVVIDVGVNRVDDPNEEKGYRLVGDVAFDEAKEVAGWITPVPGGVGPMTITMLLRNTVRAAKIQRNFMQFVDGKLGPAVNKTNLRAVAMRQNHAIARANQPHDSSRCFDGIFELFLCGALLPCTDECVPTHRNQDEFPHVTPAGVEA